MQMLIMVLINYFRNVFIAITRKFNVIFQAQCCSVAKVRNSETTSKITYTYHLHVACWKCSIDLRLICLIT